ncbi:protein of unknown function [Stenotrophomonas maltophilia]|nr:protein of unknown function [Stenotrophomonas maltophilia]
MRTSPNLVLRRSGDATGIAWTVTPHALAYLQVLKRHRGPG